DQQQGKRNPAKPHVTRSWDWHHRHRDAPAGIQARIAAPFQARPAEDRLAANKKMGMAMDGMKLVALGLAASLWTALPAWAAPWMTLTSSSIQDGARIPVRFGGDDQKRACSPRNPAICPCPGKNIS